MKIATPSFVFQVERHRALVAVQVLEIRAVARPAHGVALDARRVSILITSAPKSASWRTHVGPARTRERSRTRKRASAVEAGNVGHGKGGIADGCDRYDNL